MKVIIIGGVAGGASCATPGGMLSLAHNYLLDPSKQWDGTW